MKLKPHDSKINILSHLFLPGGAPVSPPNLEPNKCKILSLTVRSEFVLGANNGPKGSQALLVQGAAWTRFARRHGQRAVWDLLG